MSLAREQSRATLPPIEDDRGGQDTAKTALELSSLGLTFSQARVYLFLLSEGASPVRSISKALGLHRVEAYRKVHDLEELGLVEQHLTSPKRYAAIAPNYAVSALLNQQKEKEALLRQRAAALLPHLNLIQPPLRQPLNKQPTTSSYRLGSGRMRYHNEMKELIREAKTEVLRILSADGVVRNYQSGFYKEYFRAASRGIKVRMITEVSPQNKDMVKRLSRIITVRYLHDIRLRFTVIDKSVTVFGTSYKPGFKGLEQNSYIIFRDPSFASAFCFFFDHIWDASSPRPLH